MIKISESECAICWRSFADPTDYPRTNHKPSGSILNLSADIIREDNEVEEAACSPMQSPCGHIFGSECLLRALQKRAECLICREDLPHTQDYRADFGSVLQWHESAFIEWTTLLRRRALRHMTERHILKDRWHLQYSIVACFDDMARILRNHLVLMIPHTYREEGKERPSPSQEEAFIDY